MNNSADAAGKSNISDILPLTSMQESMLFQYLKDPGNGQYFEQLILNLTGVIDMQVFIDAWEHVVQMNEPLRTVFRWDKLEQPVQIILKEHEIPISELDYSGCPEDEKQEALNKTAADDRNNGIDIAVAPLRITLCKMAEANYAMIISNHHILYDGWSNGILINEFLEAYNRIRDGKVPGSTVLKYKIKDFIRWQRRQDQKKQKEFWERYLQGFDTKTLLPGCRRGSADVLKTGELTITLQKDLSDQIRVLARRNDLTNAVIFYCAWGLLLQKYNNSGDVVFGTTVSGRTGKIKGIESIVGLLINTLPLRIKSESGDSVLCVLKAASAALNEMEEFESSSLADIRQYSEVNNSDTLFDSIIAVENYPLDRQLKESKGHIQVTGYLSHEKTNFDLTLAIMPFEDMQIKFIYNSELFGHDVAERLSGQYIRILGEIAGAPEKKLKDLDILSEVERNLLLGRWNDTVTDFPRNKTLQALFEEQAAGCPDATALKLDDVEMTYGELNERANRLAWFLRKEGVRANSIVGLMMERSFEMLIGILGILKAGGAYLPLDPEFPRDRTAAMVKDAKALLLVSQEPVFKSVFQSAEHFQSEYGMKAVLLDKDSIEMAKHPGDNPDCTNESDDLAYVMYTSGSTGTPKGILTTHYNVSRVVRETNYIKITAEDVLLQLSNYAFDGSTFDIFGALLNGAKLILTRKETFLDFSRLTELIRREGVTVFFITTALFNTLVDLDAGCLKNVRKVLFGGERVSVQHVRKALQAVGTDKLVHVYGPTETTVFASYYPIKSIDDSLGTIPIGRPIANTEVYVLDRDLKLVPPGCPGELYIAGAGLAKGYLDREQLNHERFLEHPFKNKGFIYKTGDLARWLPDGNLEFMDRLDGQIKLRGFRVELGEIESRLLEHEKVKKAVVAAKEDKSGNKILCAYLVTETGVEAGQIRDYLSKELPYYMIPSQIAFLEELPVTPTGKVDMKALSDCLEVNESTVEYEAPSSETEESLEHIWKEVLNVDRIGVNDNFFDLGGHSLKATVLASKISKVMGVVVPLGEIFKNATIRQLAGYITSADKKTFKPILPAGEREFYPVSSAQKRMFVQQYAEGIDTAYNIPIALELRGQLDTGRLVEAMKELVKRHEALRTSFHMVDGEIVQKINSNVELNVEFCETDPDRLSKTILESIHPFDMEKAPLMRIKLIQLSADRHVMLMDIHHIVSDGISLAVLIEEAAGLYDGKQQADLTVQYKDFSAWQEDFLSSDRIVEQDAYWTNKLSGEIPVLNVPLDYKRLEKRSFKGGSVRFNIPEQLSAELESIAKREKLTLNNLLLSVYFTLLNKYTGQKDIIVGSLVAGRRHPDIERVVGMFNNFLPLRVNMDTGVPFVEFLKAAGAIMLDAYENQEYPYDRMIENRADRFDPSRNPLFDTMLIFHNQMEAVNNIKFGELTLSNVEFGHNTSKLDFKLDVYPDAESGGLRCILEYNAGLFRCETIERMAGHFLNIAVQVVKNPDQRLDEIDMLSGEEKKQNLFAFNDTQAEYPREELIHLQFEERVKKTPGKPAVIFEDSGLTYGGLNARANQLARVLREKGVGRDGIVGVLLDRSLEMSVGIMAVLKAGGAYLPISPDYPDERIKYMLEDSGAAILLTQGSLGKSEVIGSLESGEGGRKPVTVIDLEDAGLYTGDSGNLERVNRPEDLAYVIYTSGSTGKPKGVMIEHYSLVNRLNWMQKAYPIGEGDTILQKTPYTFDVSVWEMFWWSAQGAKVCFLKPGGEKDPGAIVEAIEKNGVTTMHFVPSMLAAFLGYVENGIDIDRLKSLRQVFASGEALNPQLVAKFNKLLYAANGTKLHNLYGPTEATVDVSYFNCSTGEEFEIIPIGKPIDNIRLYILNPDNMLQPVGIPGELHIAGDGLARGYLNRPELTSERFIADPFKPGERMYRTGDLARWLSDGNIEYLGRMDNQVKVRGFRIELGEVEAELLKHPDVTEAVVSARDDREGNKYLCAYIVSERELSVMELREHLAGNLPEYMIPSTFVKLESIPLSPNGKVDRKALPEPEGGIGTGRDYAEPTNEIEERLVEIWKEVLGVERVGINDSFFELGGHSLKAASLAVKIHKAFSAGITIGEIFQAATVKNLAGFISQAKEKVFESVEKVDIKEYYPVSSSQKRLFIINQLEGDNTTYNLPSMTIVEGEVDAGRFESVFGQLIKRHESLRTSFRLIGEDPVQIIHDDVKFDIDFSECSGEEGVKQIAESFIRPFDLSKAPLIRVALVKINPERHLLLFDLHHIIADGVSAVILVKEFARLYSGGELPELKIQFKDYAAWQNALVESEEIDTQKAYWLDTFKGTVPVLNLPTDYVRPSLQSGEGDRLTFGLNDKIVDGLKRIATEKGATLYMALLAVYNTLLHKYTGQEDIVVGSPTAGRQHADVENVIGMFVNTLALRSYPEGRKTFGNFLGEVKDNAFTALENQDYQFERLVDTLDLPRDISRNPMFDTMFVLQNLGIPQMEFGGLKFLPYGFENKASKFDLTFEVVENEADARINIEYCTRLFKRETIERMAGHFLNIAVQVVKNPDQRLDEIDMLSGEEKKQNLFAFNDTQAEYPREELIHLQFEERVKKTPGKPAVIFEDSGLTYGGLNARANQLARVLREKGVGRDGIVGVLLDRSLEMSVGIMAVLKAGGAYLPISPDYPDERIKYMLEDSGAAILLTQGSLGKSEVIGSLESGEGGRKPVTVIDLEDAGLYTGDSGNLERVNRPEDLAYVIYTSGSTGKPKGVMIEHYSLVNRLNWMQKAYPIGEGDTILQKTPYTFDVSVWEMFWWSAQGAKVCFLKPGGEKDPGAIVEAIEKNGVTTMHFVPSMLAAFLGYVENGIDIDRLKSLRQVFASGEALNPQLVAKFNKLLYAANGTKLHNLYGPTEATVDVSYFNCSTGEEFEIIPIGKPIDNIRLYILNPDNMLQPVGIPGELHIAGDGLARGYLNRPELTSERFIADPFKPGERMYRTGDLARWLSDGNIEYLGRMDNQVKVRGFRIELGEVEAELLKHPDVTEAVVSARDDREGNKYLCAYIVSERELSVMELREHLAGNLPEYMIPSTFVKLESIPLSPNGKVDRKALPEPEGGIGTGRDYAEPTNEIEERLVEIWKEVLGVERVGINDRFFELGGYSILLIKMHAKVDQLYPGKVKITDLFAYPTVAMLADFIQNADGTMEIGHLIKTVELPQEYFMVEEKSNKEVSLKLNLDESIEAKMVELTETMLFSRTDILLSVYAYLLCQISTKEQLTIQTAAEKRDIIYSIPIDLQNVNKFSDLFKQVCENMKNITETDTYRIKDTGGKSIPKERCSVVPLLYKSDMISPSFDVLELYDIAFEIGEEAGRTSCLCRFNGRRLNKVKMKEFAGLYIKLLELFLG